jgi:hypothetical protein
MAYVAFLEQRINDNMETRSEQIEKCMETRISYLEELLRDRSLSMFQSHSFSSGLDNSMNHQMGLNFSPSSLQDYSIYLPRTNRRARTHADMLAILTVRHIAHCTMDNADISFLFLWLFAKELPTIPSIILVAACGGVTNSVTP